MGENQDGSLNHNPSFSLPSTKPIAVQTILAEVTARSERLMQAYYAGAIDTELLRKEQERIRTDKTTAERQLRHLQTSRDKLHTALDQCLSVLHNGQQQYLAATDNSRRDLNQAVFDKIYLDDDEITNSHHKAVYRYLLDSNLPAVLESEAKEQQGVVASETKTRQDAVTPDRQRDAVTPDNMKNLQPMAGGSKITLLVELRGFEPLTSSMPWKRATNCAIAPRAAPDYRMLSPVGKAALAACFRAVAMVSMAASSWATERNHASKAEGGNATPPSSIAWKNRP